VRHRVFGAALLAALGVVPLVTSSEFWLTFFLMALLFALLGQSWNVLGGYGGQFSFGHALFFGLGAYATGILQVRHGVPAWPAAIAAVAIAAAVGAAVGALVFRYRLRGSYFALVTLAFAEVARILAASFDYTGSGFGILIALAPGAGNFQFADRRVFYWLAWALVCLGCLVALWLERSRFGARLIAIRENEAAAQALGIDPLRTKTLALALSGGIAGVAGVLYMQIFLFADSHIAFGPTMSVEALLAPIIGGLGTAFGPLLGAILLHALGEVARHATGGAPGLSLVLYGVLLIVMLRFLPDGIAGLARRRARG
jgi:branched-chain amino acid transport system permease protein